MRVGNGGISPYADVVPQPASATIHYERRPELDKRLAHGDDYAGDAWVRWTAVGHSPEGERGEVCRTCRKALPEAAKGCSSGEACPHRNLARSALNPAAAWPFPERKA